jgi:pimeloyl-ACP methyl ester carboxylesterase
VLVMGATPEEATPAEFAEDVATRLPHGEYHRFDDLGHFGPLENPGAVAAVIGRFFTAQGA